MVAETILSQIQALGRIQMWSWGSHDFKKISDRYLTKDFGAHLGALSFKVNGRLFQGEVAVVLMPSDTYTVFFGTLKDGRFTHVKKFDDVYCDMLVDLIDSTVETP